MALVKLYHATTQGAADSIMQNGFRSRPGGWHGMDGVFFSLRPVDVNEGAKGDVYIEVVIETTAEEMFRQFEVIEPGKPYREFVIPPDRINYCHRRILSAAEVDAALSADNWNEYPPGEPAATWGELVDEPIDD